jgi:hypothetical protein
MTPPDHHDQRHETPALRADEQEHTVSNRQVKRLIKLAKNFDKAVEVLPDDKGKVYKREQKELADTRRRAQMNEGLLRMRVR